MSWRGSDEATRQGIEACGGVQARGREVGQKGGRKVWQGSRASPAVKLMSQGFVEIGLQGTSRKLGKELRRTALCGEDRVVT